ncbi:MAG: ATP-dependent DNA helicase DinG [Agarilytica sp.]
MLDKEIKTEIQQAYSHFLEAKSLSPRYGQKLMIAEIARTIGAIEHDAENVRTNDAHVCVIEAGTGTGKTVAYLLSVLPIAKALDKRVVLATATIALQEQIVIKDIPDVLHHSGMKFNVCLAKGRSRYLCLSKLDRILSSDDASQLIPVYEEEAGLIDEKDVRLYNNMMGALSDSSWDGDRDNWSDEIEPAAWQRVTTDYRQCSGRKCSHVRNCAFFNARDALAEADLVVANHDLVLSDLALGGGAILPAPEETIYIFDEGHHLPDKALNHFSHHSRYKSTIRWLGQSEGQWPALSSPLLDASYFTELAQPLEHYLKATRSVYEEHLHVLQDVTSVVDRSQNSPRLRFEKGEAPEVLETLAQKMCDVFADLIRTLNKLYDELTVLIDEDYPVVPKVDLESVYPVIGSWLARAEATQAMWVHYTNTKLDEKWPFARWISLVEFNDVVDFEIVASPILAARTLEKDLWSRCYSAVVTSATLTALNSFDRFVARAGTSENSNYKVMPSPFNFGEAARLNIPDDAVEANKSDAHTESVIDLLPDIIDVKKGTLVLFSSRRQMMEVYDELPSELHNKILMQGIESKQALVEKHRKAIDAGRGSIIFGLASFAEGVDLPGDYCSHVIIAKIPFSVPDDPLEAALSEWIEARGGNSFMQISVPDASMRLIQACGRLLRTETDTGDITILDKRLISKRYGKALLDALPPFARSF